MSANDQPVYVSYPTRGAYLNAFLLVGWFVTGVLTAIHEVTH